MVKGRKNNDCLEDIYTKDEVDDLLEYKAEKSVVTSSINGLMSSADKTKLDKFQVLSGQVNVWDLSVGVYYIFSSTTIYIGTNQSISLNNTIFTVTVATSTRWSYSYGDTRGETIYSLSEYQAVLTDFSESILLKAHPVGSYYWSSESTSPATLFGGTWTRVTDKFVLAAGSTYTAGATGGAATVTLTTSQIPSHTHTFTGNALAGHSHKVPLHGCGNESTGYGLTASNFFKDNVKTGASAANGDLSSSVSAGTPSGTNSNTGGGEAHNNMPPYEVAYCWKRTA